MVAQIVRNINPYLPGGWGRALPYGGRLVIKRRSARVERRHLRAKRSHTSSRWLWIAKAKVCLYASSWTTGLRWPTSATSRHRPAPKGEGLRAVHIPRCMVFTRKETRRKAPFLRQAQGRLQDRPKVTQNGHSERSNLAVALRHCRSREPPVSAVGKDGPRLVLSSLP